MLAPTAALSGAETARPASVEASGGRGGGWEMPISCSKATVRNEQLAIPDENFGSPSVRGVLRLIALTLSVGYVMLMGTIITFDC